MFGAQQDAEDAGDPEAYARRGTPSLSLVQEDQVGRQLKSQRDCFRLTAIETGLQEPNDPVALNWPRLEPALPNSLFDARASQPMWEVAQFRLDSAGNPDLA